MAAEYDAIMDIQGESQDGHETATNPLLLPVVLDILCNICDLADLKRFRLVCKPWYEHSLRRWRKCMVLCISEDARRETLETDTNLGICNAKALIDDLPEIRNKPYHRFSVRLIIKSKSSEDSRPTREDYEAFWNVIGPMMISLRLEMWEPLFDWKLSPWLIVKTPNLDSLALALYGREDFLAATDGKVHTKLTKYKMCNSTLRWTPILKTFPNPNGTNITLMPIHLKHIRVISDAMLVLGEPNRTLFLNCEYLLHGENEIMQLLLDLRQTPNLQFLEFGIEFWTDYLDITNILEGMHLALARTLKTLRVRNTTINLIPVNRLLQNIWPQLEHLTVWCPVVRNLNFLQYVPNLCFLQLDCVLHHDQLTANVFDNTNMKLSRLKTLVVEMIGGDILRDYEIALVANLAQNLNDLTAPLDNGSLRALCTSLKEIRHLNVTGGDCDDEGITGIADGTKDSFPNIKDIKYLYSFKTSSTNLSDLSIHEGFLKMDHLRRMDMDFASTTSDAAFAAISERFPNVKRLELAIPRPNI